MLEFLLILMVAVSLTATIVAFMFGLIGILGLLSSENLKDTKTPLLIILMSTAFIYVNLKFVGVGNVNSFIQTYTKEEVSNKFKKATINEDNYLVSDDISLKIDDLNYYKLLCDDYSLTVYEANKFIKLYFYEYKKKRGLFGEVSCTEQKILKGE